MYSDLDTFLHLIAVLVALPEVYCLSANEWQRFVSRQRLYGVHLRDSISDLAGICRLARQLSEQANRHAHGDVAMDTLAFEGMGDESDTSSSDELGFTKSESAIDFESLVCGSGAVPYPSFRGESFVPIATVDII